MTHNQSSKDEETLELLERFDKYWQVNGNKFGNNLTKPFVSDLLIWLRTEVALKQLGGDE